MNQSQSIQKTVELIKRSSQGDSNVSQIDDKDLDITLKIMDKLKKIQKKGLLSKFKRASKKHNHLFHKMSQFFHQKQKNKQINRQKKRKQLRKLQKKVRFQSKINSSTLNFIHAQANEPQIQQKQSSLSSFSNLLKCHICSAPYQQMHQFYGHLCTSCATINLKKRNQSANMKGLTALVTGARIKIGYEIALKLLRDGATVYATSRFPNDTLLRYQGQKDYNNWKQNLFIIQCDFLSQTQVMSLINYIHQNLDKLDILVNNAAQTITRPKQFYTQQLANQELNIQYPNKIDCSILSIIKKEDQSLIFPSVYSSVVANPGQIDLNCKDQFGQPTDKRIQNSWVQKIEEVPLVDCYTTQVINSIVPFYLISQLKSKMIGSTPSWVLNVSSMQGVFYRFNKQDSHPHTNMAKAALNMITRTSASQFKNHNIFMNSIDTGWVTNENPYHIAKQMSQKHLFKCPLDCIDGAMRVLDPIYLGLLHKQFPFGQFLKNYKSSNW